MSEQTKVMRYEASYASQAQERFAADAAQAAQHGWYPTGQTWTGQELVVTYTYGQPAAARWAPPAGAYAGAGAQPAPYAIGFPQPASVPATSMESTFEPRTASIAIGGVLVAVASALPWATSPLVSRSGLDGGLDGFIMLGIGIGLVSLGISMATSPIRRAALYRVAFLSGLVALGWSLAAWYNVTSNIDWQRNIGTFGADYVQTGYGLLVAMAGSLVAIGAAVSVWRSERKARDAH